MREISDETLPPIVVGAAGLLGRQQTNLRLRPQDDLEEESDVSAPGPAIPSSCLRVLSSPLGHGCSGSCPGVQRDGGCLCDIVRAANEQEVAWSFEVDPEGYWVYAGQPLT